MVVVTIKVPKRRVDMETYRVERGKPRELEIQIWWESFWKRMIRDQGNAYALDKCLSPRDRLQNMAYKDNYLIRRCYDVFR